MPDGDDTDVAKADEQSIVRSWRASEAAPVRVQSGTHPTRQHSGTERSYDLASVECECADTVVVTAKAAVQSFLL